MRVVITHTDLRIYWPSRILALQQALESRGDELYTIEIAGAGSHYAFHDHASTGIKHWIYLFPHSRMEDISPARASIRLQKKLDELAPDVIMAGAIAYPSGAAAVYWAKKNHRPVVIFDDIRPENVPRNALVNYIKKLIYTQVDAVLCPAPPWTAAFQYWNFRPQQIFFGVNVVDNAFWSKYDPRTPPPDGMTGWPDPFFLAVGRQIPAKNLLFLLEVYEAYRRTAGRRCLPLVIVGEGPQRKTIERFIMDKGLEQVHLFPFVSPEKLRAFYHHAAALVLPSTLETWGLVVNEAMAAGLPVVVSKTCGCASVLVQENINGYTFYPDRPDQLLAALLFHTNKSTVERAAMARASKRIIQPWGLDQFVKGSLYALDYALANRKTCRSLHARWVLRSWKGRYRPI